MNQTRKDKVITVSVLMLCFLIFSATASAANLNEKIDRYIAQEMAKYQIPGLSIAVVKNGKIVKMKDYGVGSVEFDTPLGHDTVFQLFSTSKIFAGVAVMKLVEDGKLSLDTPVTDIIQSLPGEWKAINVRNLLTHTSGLPGVNANARYACLPKDKADELKADEFIKYVAELPLSFKPGEKFSYGQSAYILAGMIVEKLSGKSYADFLRERFFSPLAMNSTRFGGTGVFIERRPPTVYNRENNLFKTWNYPFAPKDFPAAGLNSSASDLSKFFIALDAGRVIRPQSLTELWAPMKLNDGKESLYGLGWDLKDHKGYKVVGHEGGGSIWAAHFPGEHLSVIVLCNLNGARADEIQYGIADMFLDNNKEDKGVKNGSMALVNRATFTMGTDPSKLSQIAEIFDIKKHPDMIQSESPQHAVTVSSYYIDKYEVTNAQFQKFIKKQAKWSSAQIPKQFNNGNYLKDWNGSNFPQDKAQHPVVNVSWQAAVAYCESVGKRLPTEAEWEYAARGGLKDKTFPWGDEPVDKTRANYLGSETKATTPVGSYPANGYGLFDMAGNVWEFMADEWAPYSAADQNDPVAGGNLFVDDSFRDVTTRRVIRGGSWGGAPLNLRVTYRDSHPPDGSKSFVGFRCAMPSGKWQ